MFNDAWFWLLQATMISVVFVEDQLVNKDIRRIEMILTLIGVLVFAFVGANIADKPWHPIVAILISLAAILAFAFVYLSICTVCDKKIKKKKYSDADLHQLPGLPIHFILLTSMFLVKDVTNALLLILFCALSIPIAIVIKRKREIKAKEERQKALIELTESLGTTIGKRFWFTYTIKFHCRDDGGRRYEKWVESTDEIEVMSVSVSGLKYKNKSGSIETISCYSFSEYLSEGKIRPML